MIVASQNQSRNYFPNKMNFVIDKGERLFYHRIRTDVLI